MGSGRLMIVGNPETNHIGSYFRYAASAMGISTGFADVRDASSNHWLINKIYWHGLGHRPSRINEFGRSVFRHCQNLKPQWLLCTGLAPLDSAVLKKIGGLGIGRINYLTDDPWNPVHRADWFLKALPYYDYVFSVRKTNISDLEKLGVPRIFYLPFGYAPEIHYPELPATEEERNRYGCDVVFIGGADKDRLPYIRAIIRAGLDLHLYGGYWDRFADTRKYWKGYANPEQMRKAVSGAKVNLCLVRRANRDGNSMRTFEVPAMKGCMLAEDTDTHRELFATEGNDLLFFSQPEDMLKKADYLLKNVIMRFDSAMRIHQLIMNGHHTYAHRLQLILEVITQHEH
jgi:hypothetical protein